MRRLHRPQRRLAFWLHDVEDPVNVGSIFRTGDALGVDRVHLSGITPRPPHKLITRVGRNKDRRVSWSAWEEAGPAIQDLRSEGWSVLALEITPRASSYESFDFPEASCLLLGHEDHGVPQKILELCTAQIFIPMYGKGASLNVATAGAVVAYHALHGVPG